MTQPYYEPERLWRPAVPSPYVTHQDIAPMHSRLGAMEKGQESYFQALAGHRAEMLTRMDRIETLLATKPPENQGGVTLTMREMVVMAVALVLAGAILGRLMGVDRLLGGG